MKKVYVLALACVFAFACKKGEIGAAAASTPGSKLIKNENTQRALPVDGKYPEMTFETTSHDFGTIKPGDVVSYNFVFTNTGEADLLIESAKGTCGCTVPEFPKDPIKPGEKGEMKVSFNSAGKKGMQNKSVNIVTNTKSGAEQIKISTSIEEVK